MVVLARAGICVAVTPVAVNALCRASALGDRGDPTFKAHRQRSGCGSVEPSLPEFFRYPNSCRAPARLPGPRVLACERRWTRCWAGAQVNVEPLLARRIGEAEHVLRPHSPRRVGAASSRDARTALASSPQRRSMRRRTCSNDSRGTRRRRTRQCSRNRGAQAS